MKKFGLTLGSGDVQRDQKSILETKPSMGSLDLSWDFTREARPWPIMLAAASAPSIARLFCSPCCERSGASRSSSGSEPNFSTSTTPRSFMSGMLLHGSCWSSSSTPSVFGRL